MPDVLVFSEKPALLAELVGGGIDLGGQVSVVVFGDRPAADAATAFGAQRVLWIEAPPNALVEDVTPTLEQLVRERQPALVIIGATRRGRVVAGRLAARLDTTALTDILELRQEDGALQARHMVWGGGAVRSERLRASPVVATAGVGVYSMLPSGQPASEIIPVAFMPVQHGALLRERKPRAGAVTNLGSAKRVVCAGRGLAKAEDLGLINELARALNAEVGCTRPLAEGLNWLPRERYIGISGAQVRPDLYLGVGVSGQVQHMIGMNRSKVVIAINKDKNAPIFASADYGIVGDLYALVPALLQEIKNKR